MTAVEWLREKLRLDFGFVFSDNILEQAKEMEKEQIERAYKMGRYESDMVVMSDKFYAEQYYNETFKSE
jgi:hypothetical protein